MESMRIKRRGGGFMKAVMPFYKPSKPTTSSPSPLINSSTSSSKGYVVSSSVKDHAAVTTVVNPDHPNKSKKVSFISTVQVGDDEAVDLKAANYISCVQERFRLQRLSSERRIANMVPQDAQ